MPTRGERSLTIHYKVVLPDGYDPGKAYPGILADYKIQDGKFHIAGPSNGGIAAFRVAAANPQYFLSVTAFPGYMWEPSAARLQAISKMCVFMFGHTRGSQRGAPVRRI